MNIVVVTGGYHPNYSAVGICAKNIVDELVARGNNVWVLCNKTSADDVPLNVDGALVRYYTTREIERRIANKGWRLTLVRAYYYCRFVLSRYSLKRDLIRVIENYLSDIESNELCGESPDIVLCTVFPVESIAGAVEWKRRSGSMSKLIPIIFDNFVENPSLHRLTINRAIKRNRHIRLLKGLLADCERILVMHNQKDFFERNNMLVQQKIYFVEHPLLIQPKSYTEKRKEKRESAKLLYSGALLKNYVVADDLCRLLTGVLKENGGIQVEFCIMGNDTQKVADLANTFPDHVINNGRVPMSVALEKMHEADVFLCIAEKSGRQISSKIFTYMSFGKPIILVYYNDDDVNDAILKKYPLYLSVNAVDIDYRIDTVLSFILHSCRARLTFDEVASIYPEALPGSICDLVLGS